MVRMRRARILRIVTRLNVGGPASYLVSLFRAMDASRYEQRLIAGREGPQEGSMWSFVEAHALAPILVPDMIGTPTLRFKDIPALHKIRGVIREFQPDIVETQTSKAGGVGRLAAFLERSPVTLHVYHGHVLSGYFDPIKSLMTRSAERLLALRTSHFVAVSQRIKTDLVRYRIACPDAISVIEPGLELAPLLASATARGRLRHELGLASDTPLVAFVGRLAPVKNPGLFLDAAAGILTEVPDARFLIVGDGELGPEMRQRARQLGITERVIFTGWRADLPNVYADLNVLVSSSDNEGLPFTVIEAMAAGCPIVATAVGGLPDLIDDQMNGLLVPPRDPQDVARAVVRVIRDPAFASALSDAARRDVQLRFHPVRFAADMSALYDNLLRSVRK